MKDIATENSDELAARFSGLRILVVGDVILDRFVWGRVERISPEAPVPVVEVERESHHSGGAANVASNLAVLGARPILVGLIGPDQDGERLKLQLNSEGIETDGLIVDPERSTSAKARVMAGHQQVCRTDRETRRPVAGAARRQLLERCRSAIGDADAVVLSDYAKGALSSEVIGRVISFAKERDRFVCVDPKTGDFGVYRGASMVTPNKKEAEAACGFPILDEDSLRKAGRLLMDSAGLEHLLITRGEQGMTLFEPAETIHIPTVAREVFDVTGAGDTVIATLTAAVASGAGARQGAVLANHAASVVVGKLGTAHVTPEELAASLEKARPKRT